MYFLLDTSASSALGVLDDDALYKSTYLFTVTTSGLNNASKLFGSCPRTQLTGMFPTNVIDMLMILPCRDKTMSGFSAKLASLEFLLQILLRLPSVYL